MLVLFTLPSLKREYGQKVTEINLLREGIDREHLRLQDMRLKVEKERHNLLALEGKIERKKIELSRLEQMIDDNKHFWETGTQY